MFFQCWRRGHFLGSGKCARGQRIANRIGPPPPAPPTRALFGDSGAADQLNGSAPPGARPVCDIGKKVPNVGTAVTFEKACFAKVPTGCGSGANVPALSLLAKSARKKCARVPTGVDTWYHWRQHAHRGHFCASEKNAQMYRRHRNRWNGGTFFMHVCRYFLLPFIEMRSRRRN